MKNLKSLLVVSVLLAFGSCSLDNTEEPIVQNEGKTVTLRIAQTPTRAELGQNLKVNFQNGDMIDVNGQAYEIFEVGEGYAAIHEVPQADSYTLVYPSAYNFLGTKRSNETENMKLPIAQFYSPDSFGANAMPMYGEGIQDDPNLDYATVQMHNLCGVLKLTLKGDATINTIHIEDNANPPISGWAALKNDADGNKFLEPGATSGARAYSLVLNCGGTGEGVTLSPNGTDFYIVMPVREYPNGLTIRITDRSHRAMTIASATPRTIKRNVVTSTPAINYAPDADLVFAEYFDALAWGGDVIRNLRGYTPFQNATQAANHALGGSTPDAAFCATATGTEEAPFYTNVGATTAGSQSYSNDWNKLVTIAVNAVSADYLRNRNLYDWIYLFRCAEFQGSMRISYAGARGKIHTPPFANIPEGETHKVEITIHLCASATGTNKLGLWFGSFNGTSVAHAAETVESNTIDGTDFAVTSSQFCYIPEANIHTTTQGWSEVKIIASGITNKSSFNIMDNANPGLLYYVDDIEVRLLD